MECNLRLIVRDLVVVPFLKQEKTPPGVLLGFLEDQYMLAGCVAQLRRQVTE